MKSEKIPLTSCPYCSYKIDASTNAFGATAPKSGDASICLNCGKVSVFTETMGLRKPSTEEDIEFAADKRIIAAQLLRATVVTTDLRKKQQHEKNRPGR